MSWQEKGNRVSLLNSKRSLSLFIKEQAAEKSTILDTSTSPARICVCGKQSFAEKDITSHFWQSWNTPFFLFRKVISLFLFKRWDNVVNSPNACGSHFSMSEKEESQQKSQEQAVINWSKQMAPTSCASAMWQHLVEELWQHRTLVGEGVGWKLSVCICSRLKQCLYSGKRYLATHWIVCLKWPCIRESSKGRRKRWSRIYIYTQSVE